MVTADRGVLGGATHRSAPFVSGAWWYEAIRTRYLLFQ
jgi:hypothetical protein